MSQPFGQWWFWLLILVIYLLVWYLFLQRSYKMEDGKPYCRSGRLGKWVNLLEHLEQEHPEEYKLLRDDERKEEGGGDTTK